MSIAVHSWNQFVSLRWGTMTGRPQADITCQRFDPAVAIVHGSTACHDRICLPVVQVVFCSLNLTLKENAEGCVHLHVTAFPHPFLLCCRCWSSCPCDRPDLCCPCCLHRRSLPIASQAERCHSRGLSARLLPFAPQSALAAQCKRAGQRTMPAIMAIWRECQQH